MLHQYSPDERTDVTLQLGIGLAAWKFLDNRSILSSAVGIQSPFPAVE